MSDTPEARDVDDDDDRLLEELRALTARVDPVPEHVTSATKAAYTWRTIDAELAELAEVAELTYDSAVDESALVGVRGADGPRLLTFETADVSIELEVTADATARRIVGQVVPPGPWTVEVRHAGGIVSAEVDELGEFIAEGIEHGPASIRLHGHAPDSEQLIATDWLGL